MSDRLLDFADDPATLYLVGLEMTSFCRERCPWLGCIGSALGLRCGQLLTLDRSKEKRGRNVMGIVLKSLLQPCCRGRLLWRRGWLFNEVKLRRSRLVPGWVIGCLTLWTIRKRHYWWQRWNWF